MKNLITLFSVLVVTMLMSGCATAPVDWDSLAVDRNPTDSYECNQGRTWAALVAFQEEMYFAEARGEEIKYSSFSKMGRISF